MGRKSRGQYPDNWDEIAYQVKEDAGWQCSRCSHDHDPAAGYCLTVHHLDLNKSNCQWWNLVALCQRCHLSIQARVVMERFWMFEHSDWFKPYAAGYYANVMGLSTDRDFVEEQQDNILETIRMIKGA